MIVPFPVRGPRFAVQFNRLSKFYDIVDRTDGALISRTSSTATANKIAANLNRQDAADRKEKR